MMQIDVSLIEWVVGVIILVVFSASFTFAMRVTPRFMEEGSTGRLSDWWRWINTPSSQDYKQKVHTPTRKFDRQVESWSCPICGSDLNPNDVEQLELGRKVECTYCGATLGSSM